TTSTLITETTPTLTIETTPTFTTETTSTLITVEMTNPTLPTGFNWLNAYYEYSMIVNGYGKALTVGIDSQDEITIQSFTASARFNDDLQLSITGLSSGSIKYQQNVTLQVNSISMVALDLFDVDTIIFNAYGGQAHSNTTSPPVTEITINSTDTGNCSTGSHLITFDDLLITAGFNSTSIPDGYHGLNWPDLFVFNIADFVAVEGTISQEYAIASGDLFVAPIDPEKVAVMTIHEPNTTFNFHSLVINASAYPFDETSQCTFLGMNSDRVMYNETIMFPPQMTSTLVESISMNEIDTMKIFCTLEKLRPGMNIDFSFDYLCIDFN
ncbi:unnamed protein product, partial [Didymodactylos carnosus]